MIPQLLNLWINYKAVTPIDHKDYIFELQDFMMNLSIYLNQNK